MNDLKQQQNKLDEDMSSLSTNFQAQIEATVEKERILQTIHKTISDLTEEKSGIQRIVDLIHQMVDPQLRLTDSMKIFIQAQIDS